MTAAEIGGRGGIPEPVILDKFGLRGKHIAGPAEHVSDMSVAAAVRLLDEHGIDPAEIGIVLYYGSLWKDYPGLASGALDRAPARLPNAYALEYANVSCGTPVALRLARNFLLAEPDLRNVLSSRRAASRTCSTTANDRSRFMFNFGDGAVAGLLTPTPAGTSCSAAMRSRTAPSRSR